MAPAPERQHYNVTLAVLLTGSLAYAVLQTMVVPALPEIQRDLGTSTTTASFVITSYLVSAAVATPIVGRFGDMFGKERLLVITLLIIGAGCVVSANAHSIEGLIAGRTLQGVGGAVFPLSFGIIRDEFPRKRVATGIGLISSTWGIGGAAGLVIAGPLVDHLGYESIFWVGLGTVCLAAIATHLFVPESPIKSPARIDWLGAVLLASCLVTLLIAVSRASDWGLGSSRVLGLLASSVVLFVVWIKHEARVPDPLVDMRMMRSRTVAATNFTTVLVGFGMLGSFILIPQYVQTSPEDAGYGFGASVTEAGLFMLPGSIAMLVAGPFGAWLGQRLGSKRPLLLGTAIGAAGFAFLSVAHDQQWMIYVGSMCQGLGIGLSLASVANIIVGSVPQRQTGVAGGMNTVMRTIGGAIGGALTASIIAGSIVGSTGIPAESGFTAAFLLGAAGMAAAALFALFGIPRLDLQKRDHVHHEQRDEEDRPAVEVALHQRPAT